VRAADRGVQAEPRSVPAWALAARLRESAGNLGDAADALRRLAEVDRKNRAEYLTGIARLESRLGRVEAAIKAGRDLLAAAPGNPEHYEFFSQLCFQLGRSEEGLDALRRAVRVNPNDTKIVLTLAENLAGMYRTDEAIEMYWRAFEKSNDLDDKLGVVSKMTALYLQRNQFDRLLTRLQHQERDVRPDAGQSQQRDVALCIAQAYAASGDMGAARAQIEPLLATNARDTQLLLQMSKLAEEEGDLESAARYQKQLNDLAPTDEGATRLAQLYARYGELEEAQAVWSHMAADKGESAHRILQAIDSLLGHKKAQPVAEITASMVRKEPGDWEALYRQGVALADLDKREEAARSFRALLALRLGDDEKSAIVKARTRDPKLKNQGTSTSWTANRKATMPLEDRIGITIDIRNASHLSSGFNYVTSGQVSAWAPQDYGQARMAALGWLLSLAQRQGSGKGEEVIASFRKAAEKKPADVQALWDGFYLCQMRFDNAGAYAAARELTRATPTDPLALWAYLYALGGRQLGLGTRNYSYSGRERVDGAPPLEKVEVDHVLACYQALRTRRPELAQAQILQNISEELKRAKRTEDSDRFYRDALANSQQFAQVAGAFTLAARRGDVEGLCQLLDRFERLQSGRNSSYYYTGSYYFAGPGTALSEGMSVCAGRKAYDDVLKILDYEFATLRRRLEHQSPGAAARAIRAQYATSPQYQIWVGKSSKYIRVEFPLPNDYVDETAIQALRTAFELYKRDDLVSDLVAHFHKQAEAASTSGDAAYPRLCASYVLLWNGDKDEAIAEFVKVAEISRPESGLRLELAELYEQQGDRDDALAAADAVQPLDNATMKRREELALRVAVLSGNLDRARQAAERLFGLRLDTDTQVRLASQMHQLGLHELAEAVLGRARRRAGNKAAALVALMLQYQRQDKLDVAVQVAMQILRSTTATRQSNPNVYNPDNPDAARQAAIGVLSRSGRLNQLIDKAKEQLQKTPNAVQVHQALADYYKAANRRDEARSELARIAQLRPDDLNLRFQIAQQLVQDGQAAAAIEHYKVILKKDPSVLSRQFYQIPRTFQQANKLEELLALFETIDLRQLSHPYYVIDTISTFLDDDKLRDRAMPLLRKAWDAFPDYRHYVFGYLRGDAVWKYPEVYDYALESVIPRLDNFAVGMQWEAFDQILAYGRDGRVTTMMTRFLDLAASQGKLDELSAKVDAARKALPHWKAGDVVRALVDCRLGRFDRAGELIRHFLDETKDESLYISIFATIGSELENYPATRDLALSVYETTIYRDTNQIYSRFDFDNGAARRLVALYTREDRLEDARRVLVDFIRYADESGGYDQDYIQQMRLMALSTVAGKLAELGFAADAVAFYDEALALEREIPRSGDNYIGNREQIARQCREGISRTLDSLKDDELKGTLDRVLAAEKGDTARPGPTADKGPGPNARKAKKPAQAVNLMVLIHPRELDKARVRSLVAESIAGPSKGAVPPDRAKPLEAAARALEAMRKEHPDDLSVGIAEALVALGLGDAGLIDPALERLQALVEKHPLESLPEGARANSRQRAEAARQVPLWLVARACRQRQPDSSKLRTVAEKLEARAIEAARRQADNTAMMAMLREQGEQALAQGDPKGAEGVLTRMLETVVAPPKKKPRQPDAGSPAASQPAQPAGKPTAALTPSGADLPLHDRTSRVNARAGRLLVNAY
jgi:predicted Zn-dependent protease